MAEPAETGELLKLCATLSDFDRFSEIGGQNVGGYAGGRKKSKKSQTCTAC